MVQEASAPASRRAVLAAGLGGLVAYVAHALGRPLPARATHGDVHLGAVNDGASTTAIRSSTGDGVAGGFVAGSEHYWPDAGVVGGSSVVGVRGDGHPGILGYGGVMGALKIGDLWDIEGMAQHTAIYGAAYGHQIDGPPPPTIGVLGHGHSVGVRGDADQIGGQFSGRIALQASGAVKFSSSGLGTIARGTRSKLVYPGLDLTATSKIFVTLQGSPGGTTSLQRVQINTTLNRFMPVLTANATADTRFAWFVIS